MAIAKPPTSTHSKSRFSNAAEWLHALGDVPLERIVMNPAPGTATEADLLHFAERDKRLCELVDGTLVEKPAGAWESIIAARVATQLGSSVDARGLGAVCGANGPMRMKTKRIRMPDASFISLARLPKTWDRIFNFSPDLVVEVLSKTNTEREIQQKLDDYFKSGTRIAWIIDPKSRTAAVYHDARRAALLVDEHGFLDGDPVLPGLRFLMAELFVDVPR
ncbi:MAG TPA: Uma2 family endonuclease [Tepidisphaeraceae bacterium]|jgi:Uma2 family endonuclease|nr:Uma2 family endonuclease [Tepidisphaeraceae bacterium]